MGGALLLLGCSSLDVLGSRALEDVEAPVGSGGAPPAVVPNLPNLLEERTNVPLTEVRARVNAAFLQLFYGDPATEAVFRDQGDGTAYIEDIANNDVRTDSMAYGMLVTVQLDQREVFDKLWSWTKQRMLAADGPREGLLNWRCDTTGANCDSVAATDSTSLIATSLFMADSRWGEAGAHPYQEDALALLEAATTVESRNGGIVDGVMNLFDLAAALPRMSSVGPVGQTPTEYLMPAFYEIWAAHDAERALWWRQMAENSRSLLAQVGHPESGLLPAYVNYEGTPIDGKNDYEPTTHRTLLNLALDDSWNGPSTAGLRQTERLLDFFLSEGLDDYVSHYSRKGEKVTTFNTSEHRALVAVAAGLSTRPEHEVFLERLLAEPIPSGTYRYYDGMLYMLSLLQLSGQLTIRM